MADNFLKGNKNAMIRYLQKLQQWFESAKARSQGKKTQNIKQVILYVSAKGNMLLGCFVLLRINPFRVI